MNCTFEDLPIGSRVAYSDFFCLVCKTIKTEYHEGTYVERLDGLHIVDLDEPVVCPDCNHHSYVLRIPCDQTKYCDILVEKIPVPVEIMK